MTLPRPAFRPAAAAPTAHPHVPHLYYSRVLSGQRLGQYEIGALLGAGGMGEVYRAHDTRLGRDVAIKILPATWRADPERLARFDREARLLASLNHPHIAAIYGVEEGDGVRGLVLELVEGETLAARLQRGPLPVPNALRVAAQVAAALDAAHLRGIVHRDLKPANIKLTPEGETKVLDFGIAKVIDDNATADPSGHAASTVAATAHGQVIGTVAYMSPEQARGQTIDKRTDIWAFGCVMFESLTARHPFGAATISDTIARVLEHEPDWTLLPADTPRALQRLLRQCLQKDPARRLRDIGDALLMLEGDDAIADGAPSGPRGPMTMTRRQWALAVSAAVLIAAAAGAGGRWLARPVTAPAVPVRSTVMLPAGHRLDPRPTGRSLAISSDGNIVAYGASDDETTQLYVRRLDSFEVNALEGTADATQPFFSPDGEWIAFFARGGLYKIPVAGGVPSRICDIPRAPYGGHWGSDGTIVFAMREDGVLRVPASGGTATKIAMTTRSDRWPQFLPDGSVMYTSGNTVVTMSRDGASHKVIIDPNKDATGETRSAAEGDITQAIYLATGHIVYGQGLMVHVVSFDLATHTVNSAPVRILQRVFRSAGGGATVFAISDTGTVAFAPMGMHDLTFVTRDGRATPISPDRDAFRFPRLSPDDKQLAITVDTESRRSHIWVYDVERGTKARITSDRHNIMAIWGPTANTLTYFREQQIVMQAADGSGTPATVVPKPSSYPSSWSPDGKHLLYHTDMAETLADLWSWSPEGDRKLLATAGRDSSGFFSPDGQWFVYRSGESGRDQIYLASYPTLQNRHAVSVDGGEAPVWSRNGREIFYRRGRAVMAVDVDTTNGVRLGRPHQLFDGPFVGATGESFDVTSDGRFAMVRGDDAALGRQISLITNWSDELRRIAASR